MEPHIVTSVSITPEEMEQLQALKKLSKNRKHIRHGAAAYVDLSKLEQTTVEEVTEMIEISNNQTESIHVQNTFPSRNNSKDDQIWHDCAEIFTAHELHVTQSLHTDFDIVLETVLTKCFWHDLELVQKHELISFCLRNIETKNSKNYTICTKALLFMMMGLPNQCVGSIPLQLSHLIEVQKLLQEHQTMSIILDQLLHHMELVTGGKSESNVFVDIFADMLFL
jgi:hypothetical protein